MSQELVNQGGRPPHEPTDESRRTVSIAAGAGMSHADIASGLGIARNTLEKHYQAELTGGAYARRLEVLEALHRAATGAKPNVTAAKAYMAISPKLLGPGPTDPGPEKAEKLGKKERAQRDAAAAGRGTGWDDVLPRVGEPLQ